MEVIVRTLFDCNGNCAYCSAARESNTPPRFDPDALRPMFERFRDWLVESPKRTLRFLWFGGEPLLMGKAFYRRVVEEQRAVFGDDLRRVRNLLQTNLALLDEGWIPVLKALLQGEPVGISYDFIEGVRGLHGKVSLTDRFLPNLALLKKSGLRRGLIYVVHKGSVGKAKDIYHFFRNLDSDCTVRFNPLCAEGRARKGPADHLLLTPEEYGAFLVELLEAWVENGCRGTVTPVSSWVKAFQGDRSPLVCNESGRCASTHFEVNPDGTAFLCSRGSDTGEHPMGNIFHEPVATILKHETRKVIAARTSVLHRGECNGCPYFGVCNGGCPMASWQYHRDYHRKDWWCASRQILFRRIQDLLGHPPREAA